MGLGSAFLFSLCCIFPFWLHPPRRQIPPVFQSPVGLHDVYCLAAADILFYSLCEWWPLCGEPHISDMGSVQDWASVYPLFHWGPIPWSFYIILAVAFGFMLHVRKRNRQKYSEACRPVLGKRVDGALGRIIDLTAVFALLAGTATTFSLATPLLSMALSRVTGIPKCWRFTIAILIAICIVYTMAVYFGMKGVACLASSCVGLFFVLLAIFSLAAGKCAIS